MAKKRVEEAGTAMEGMFEQQENNANFAGMTLDVTPQDMPAGRITPNPVVSEKSVQHTAVQKKN